MLPATAVAHDGHDHARGELDRGRRPGGRRRRAAGAQPHAAHRLRGREGDRPRLSEATSVAFAPDGTAFLALKTGIIKSFDYNSGTGTFENWTTATNFADLTTNVNNYWDRGLTGIALDPQFGTAGHNFVYVNYTYNRDPRDVTPVVPKWGVPGQQYDECPAPATTDPPRAGCVVMIRVTRLTAVKNALGWVMTGPETPLLASGCFQFGSHASGDVAFGPDGKLYASAGEGASFDTRTTASTPTRAPTPATRAARCGHRTTAARATRSASTARS